jgi:ribonuclease HII
VLERALWESGRDRIAGVDEVGRGSLFGPVVAAAVILRRGPGLTCYRDSKSLTEPRREALFEKIRRDGHLWAVAEVSAAEIDGTDILTASLKAMKLAVAALPAPPDFVLVDGPYSPDLPYDQEAVVHGDARSATIAAASIVAKVHRDRLVRGLEAQFPGYGLARNKGYGTAEHLAALKERGPSPLHRRSFRGVVPGGA